jgi:hypothetical protein
MPVAYDVRGPMSIISTPVLRRLGYGFAFWIGAMHGYSLSVKDVSNRTERLLTLLLPGNRASRRMLFEIDADLYHQAVGDDSRGE